MALNHLADTSVIVSLGQLDLPPGAVVATSIVCIGELRVGVMTARTSTQSTERSARLAGASARFVVLDIDDSVATAYAELRASSGRGPSNDLWIAATAKAHGLTLLTRDQQLSRLPGVETVLL